MQLALLAIGLVAALALWWLSRRNRNALKNWNPNGEMDNGVLKPRPTQLEIFADREKDYDQFGVGRPRPAARQEPSLQEKRPALTLALLLAEREGTHIHGVKIHSALKSHGMVFGVNQVYHRMDSGKPVFSAANLLKPGTLNPADAMHLATPGLSLYMQLPGPGNPQEGFNDFISTAESLARNLNAELLDTKKRPLTPELIHGMLQQIQSWELLT